MKAQLDGENVKSHLLTTSFDVEPDDGLPVPVQKRRIVR